MKSPQQNRLYCKSHLSLVVLSHPTPGVHVNFIRDWRTALEAPNPSLGGYASFIEPDVLCLVPQNHRTQRRAHALMSAIIVNREELLLTEVYTARRGVRVIANHLTGAKIMRATAFVSHLSASSTMMLSFCIINASLTRLLWRTTASLPFVELSISWEVVIRWEKAHIDSRRGVVCV